MQRELEELENADTALLSRAVVLNQQLVLFLTKEIDNERYVQQELRTTHVNGIVGLGPVAASGLSELKKNINGLVAVMQSRSDSIAANAAVAEKQNLSLRQQIQQVERRAETESARARQGESAAKEAREAMQSVKDIKTDNMKLVIENRRLKQQTDFSGAAQALLPALWQLTAHAELIPEVLESAPDLPAQLAAMLSDASSGDVTKHELIEASLGIIVNLSSRVEGRGPLLEAVSASGETMLAMSLKLLSNPMTNNAQQIELLLAFIGNVASDPTHASHFYSGSGNVVTVLAQVLMSANSKIYAQRQVIYGTDDTDVDVAEQSHVWNRVRNKILHTLAAKLLPALPVFKAVTGRSLSAAETASLERIVHIVQSDANLRNTDIAAALYDAFLIHQG